MNFRQKFTLLAADLIKKMPPQIKSQLRRACDELCLTPHVGKPLREELEGFYSWRHTRYRIIYKIDVKKSWVIIEYLGSRKDVYRLFGELQKIKTKKIMG